MSNKTNRKKLGIEITIDTHRKLKAAAAARGIYMKEVLEEAINDWLRKNDAKHPGELRFARSLDILEIDQAHARYNQALQQYLSTPTGEKKVRLLLEKFLSEQETDGETRKNRTEKRDRTATGSEPD